jgi:hypothetical protein
VENILHLRIEPRGVLVEDRGPIKACQAISERPRSGQILDPEKDVVVLSIADVIRQQLPCEPLVPIEISAASPAPGPVQSSCTTRAAAQAMPPDNL